MKRRFDRVGKQTKSVFTTLAYVPVPFTSRTFYSSGLSPHAPPSTVSPHSLKTSALDWTVTKSVTCYDH